MAVAVATMTEILERDRRAMNHMDPETRAVHSRLEQWARWARDRAIEAFPSRTVLGRVIDEGPAAGSPSGGAPEWPAEVAEVERAVLSLGEIDRNVVRQYYLKWGPPEAHARAVHMSVAQFRRVLKRARWRLWGRLIAK